MVGDSVPQVPKVERMDDSLERVLRGRRQALYAWHGATSIRDQAL